MALGERGWRRGKWGEGGERGCDGASMGECEGLLGFNLCGGGMGQSVRKGTEEERDLRTLYVEKNAFNKRFIVRSDGNKVTARADPSCL